MKVAVVGNGPSYIDYDGWGDVVVGCKLGAPLPLKYEFTTNCNPKIFNRILEDSTWNVQFKAKQIFPPHMHYYLKTNYTSDEQKYIKSKMDIPYDKDLYKLLPASFQPALKRSIKNHVNNLTGFVYNNNLKRISTGHWSIIFSMIIFKATEIRCYGFDAHFDPALKIYSTSHAITTDKAEMIRRREAGWEYLKGALYWNDTVDFLRKLYCIPIQLVPPK
tara:strand:+ start:1330 stop:1986 length:657 start_codon:yes stop_codon:yes gene_type:complete